MTYGYGQNGQNGQLWGVSSYDQYIAGVRPGDSWGAAQQKMAAHYSNTGRDASGNSLWASPARPAFSGGNLAPSGGVPRRYATTVRYANGDGGDIVVDAKGGGGGFKALLALVLLVPVLVVGAAVAKVVNASLFPPPMTLAQALDRLPVPHYATPDVAEQLAPGANALSRLSRIAIGREALRAQRLPWRSPEALAVGAAAMKRIASDPAWDVELPRNERYAMLNVAHRFTLLKAMDGSVEAAIDSGLLDVAPGLGIYEPRLAMIAWKNALNAHPGDKRLQAVVDAYAPLIGRDAAR